MSKKIKTVWEELWDKYKKEWTEAWNSYKTVIGPFIKGTAKYAWQLVYGLIALVVKGLYETGKYWLNKLIEIIKKA